MFGWLPNRSFGFKSRSRRLIVMPMEQNALTFTAIFARATTLVDGGWRISFDLSNDEVKAIHVLSELRDQLLNIAIVPDISSEKPETPFD